VSRTPEPYDLLPDRERAWIDSLNPNPIATMTREQMFRYLSGHGLPVTFWAVKRAVVDRELPTRLIGQTRRASEFHALVWAATRESKTVSA
jgi:hypothetical protein